MPTIFVVEDDRLTQQLLRKILEPDYQVINLPSAEACLTQMKTDHADLILLDVGLPGMDGFELCQLIKDKESWKDVPVIFISAEAEIDARLRGYQVGAHDFITKPFDVREIKQKVGILLAEVAARTQLRGEVSSSSQLTTLMLSNMEEYAVLIGYLRRLNASSRPADIAPLTLEMLGQFGLAGAVQLRLPSGDVNQHTQGNNTPILTSILNHVRGLERIFQFRKQSVYNFHRLTLMVDNMPIDDPERCGRLRDHLAIAAETADERLAGLLAVECTANADLSLSTVVSQLHDSLDRLGSQAERAQVAGGYILQDMLDEIRGIILELGMNMVQEESLMEIIKRKSSELAGVYSNAGNIHDSLHALAQQLVIVQNDLNSLARPASTAAANPAAQGVASMVELF